MTLMPTQQRTDDVHAFVHTTLTRQGSTDGPLADLSFVAKDMFAIEGHTSSFGHPIWRSTHEPSQSTAPAIERLLEAGARLEGLTKMDQLAYSLIGDAGEGSAPINSHDPELFCGGSSSGSASAVAADMVDVGLGTDTAGSIRVPAAVCGLHGLRPTHGAIDSRGALPLASTFDAVGLMSKSAGAIARAFRVLAPAESEPAAVESILLATDVFADCEDDAKGAGSAVAAALAESSGAALQRTSLASFTSPEVGDLFARLQSREIWSTHGSWVAQHREHLAPDVRERLQRCEDLDGDAQDIKAADIAARAAFVDELVELVGPGTIVVLPVLPRRGPLRTWEDVDLKQFRRESFCLSAPSSLSGLPQAVFSWFDSDLDRSIGIGLLGARGADRQLLDALLRLEASVGQGVGSPG